MGAEGLNGSGGYCPLSPAAVENLQNLEDNLGRVELAIRDNTGVLRDGLGLLGLELRTIRTELLSAATNREFVHKDIVKWLLIGSMLLNVIIVVWFTGIAPMLNRNGVDFKKVDFTIRADIYAAKGFRC